MKLVLIEWVDACSVNLGEAWSEIEELQDYVKDGKCLCKNVGWVIYEDKEQIVVVAALQKNSDCEKFERAAQTFAIPKCWCNKITELNSIEKKKKSKKIKGNEEYLNK
jgi:hypothetical protein